jgi:hypothetical protein
MERRITATSKLEGTKVSYNFDHTVKITPAVLEQIIRDIVQQQQGLKVKSVKFDITREYDHHNDHTSFFDGVTVVLGDRL